MSEPLEILSTGKPKKREDVHAPEKTLQEMVYDYLAIMNSSETMRGIDCSKQIIQLGLSAMTHIYKLAFCITKNVSTSSDHCQKGIYCFIEYVEQTYKLGGNSTQPFDFMDAIVFIYEKTISDLRSIDSIDEHSGSSSAVSNILSVSQSHQAHGMVFLQCRTALEQFGRVVSVLLWVNHPSMNLTDEMEIVDAHLIDFLEYAIHNMSKSVDHSSSHSSSHDLGHSLNNDIFLFIETVKETIPTMDKRDYLDFLTSLKKQIKKQDKRGECSMSVMQACLYLKTLNDGKSLKEIAESEKWKKPSDDLAKLAFN